MNFTISLRLALRSLHRAILRTALTLLGIVIGVAAVISMLSVGQGARSSVEQLLMGLDTNQLLISASMPRNLWRNGVPPSLPPGERLTLEDYRALREQLAGVLHISMQTYMTTPAEGKANGRRSDIRVYGVDAAYVGLAARRLAAGSRFQPSDVHRAASVALISQLVATNLFENGDPVGRTIRVGTAPFVVVGVLEDRVPGGGASDGTIVPGDTTVLVPYTSLLRRLDATAPLSVVVSAQDPSRLQALERSARDVLELRRGGRRAEFVTSNVSEAVRTYTSGSRTMSILLGAVGTLALIVGGIGITNVMMMSVHERTREIGIRMATGARCTDILRQILTESALLGLIGGVIGALLGIAATKIIAALSGWPVLTTTQTIGMALVAAVVIGVVSGYYPAHRAADLNPIQALRAD